MDLRRRILSSGEIDVPDCSPDCPTLPSPPPSSSSSAGALPHFLIALISLAAAAVFFAAVYYFVLSSRRRRLGRPILPVPPRLDGPGDGAGSDEEGGAVDHHVWNIRTVGLDDRAIASIGTSEYRRVAAAAGPAADCSVCLGELRDGELVRLLPACGHPFHVPCIDTWLKAHVSCPLCRAHVAVTPAAAGEDAHIPLPSLEAEGEGLAVEPLPELPEGSESRPPVVGSEEGGFEPVRRSFSMDFSLVEERKEATFVGQSLGENSGKKGNIEIGRSLSSSGRGFFFSRLGRGRSNSVLPL